MKRFLFLIFAILLTSSVFAQYEDEADLIYTSKTLNLKQTIEGGATVNYNNGAELLEFTAELDLFPKDSYRQKITQETFNPNPEETPNGLLFTWEKTDNPNIDFLMDFGIETQNKYNEVTSKVPFPLKDVPEELEIYLQETDKIDITDEIIVQASQIASNKDDLFDVAQAIAFWIFTEIDYDLSTISAEAQQKASWVMEQRRGVCDESTVLFLSMMRSLGVPSRFVSGIAYTNSDQFSEKWNSHAWAEVYFPGYGWVPFDLTYAQFGFVDASHIKFKDDVDADTTSTSYNWKSYDIDDIEVDARSVEFSTEIEGNSGEVSDDFTLVVDPLFGTVEPGSYNVLTIKVKNDAKYYISSVLNIGTPSEVDTVKQLPIYAKPDEEKYYRVIMKVDDLSQRYEWTMPIDVHTTYGSVYETEFKVSSDGRFNSYSDVQEFLDKRTDKGNNNITLSCNYESEVFVNHTNKIICFSSNEGNTHLSAKLCIEEKCESKEIALGRNASIEYGYVSSELGLKELEFSVDYGEILNEEVIFRVSDKPKLTLGIESPENVSINDELELIANIGKVSLTNVPGASLSVKVDGVFFEYDLSEISSDTNVRVPVDTKLLKEGINVIGMTLEWKFGEVSATKEVTLNDLTFIEKIKLFFYRLFH